MHANIESLISISVNISKCLMLASLNLPFLSAYRISVVLLCLASMKVHIVMHDFCCQPCPSFHIHVLDVHDRNDQLLERCLINAASPTDLSIISLFAGSTAM